MKYAAVIALFLALAVSVQCSIIPIHAWHGDWHDDGQWHNDGHDDGQWRGDWHGGDHGDWHGDWRGDWRGDWEGDWHGGHHGQALIVDHVHAHAPIVHITHPHHEGQYIAKTRGALHTAPLAGHAASAASINLQPAPGTI